MGRVLKKEPPFVCGQLRYIRENLKMGRAEFAKLLGIPRDRLVKYETRSPLPVGLIPRLCIKTGFHPWFFLTGRPEFDRDAVGANGDLFSPSDNERRHASQEARLRLGQRAARLEHQK
jgi:hypothetical protein